jgi:hypothetical protein
MAEMNPDQQLIHDFVLEVHQRVKLDMMPGDQFHRQMEMLAHELGAWTDQPVNFGPFGGKLVPPREGT